MTSLCSSASTPNAAYVSCAEQGHKSERRRRESYFCRWWQSLIFLYLVTVVADRLKYCFNLLQCQKSQSLLDLPADRVIYCVNKETSITILRSWFSFFLFFFFCIWMTAISIKMGCLCVLLLFYFLP